MSSLLIKNGTVVTATDRYQADVYIEGELISMIGARLDVSADREIDATGCYLFPGGIDAHTHMELPFMGTHASDSFESGTLAGLHGGTTTIIDFAIQTQGESLEAAIEQWHEKADGHAVGDYVKVTLPGERDVLLIPETALLYAPYGDSVFLVRSAENQVEGPGELTVEQVFVRVGERRGDLRAIDSGLEAGQTIVSTGAFKLQNGSAIVVNNALAPEVSENPTPEDR